MKLYEHEGKALFARAGITVPAGQVVNDIAAARSAAERIGYPVVLKCQVLRGGRGKAGGVRMATNGYELESVFKTLNHLHIDGEPSAGIYIEQRLDIAHEYYAGITFDPRLAAAMLMMTVCGGAEIETVTQTQPQRLKRLALDPLRPPRHHHLLDLSQRAGVPDKRMCAVAKVLDQLVGVYFDHDALTAEINPLVVDVAGGVVAADAKLEIDDAALFRQAIVAGLARPEANEDPLEARARREDLAFVRLEGGNIGLIAGGAGLGMATMDLIAQQGGRPANFLDLGGGVSSAKTAAALDLVLDTPGIKGVLVNLFGGINNCEQMARGIVTAIKGRRGPLPPLVVKMRGHSQKEGWRLLETANVPLVRHGTTEAAVGLLLRTIGRSDHVHSG